MHKITFCSLNWNYVIHQIWNNMAQPQKRPKPYLVSGLLVVFFGILRYNSAKSAYMSNNR